MNKRTLSTFYTKIHYCATLLFVAFAACSLCGCEGEKTTILYGTVTDRNKQPVDSILVVVDGVRFTNYTLLDQVMTDKNGQYAITVTSKKYSVVNVYIPFLVEENPKYERYYKGFVPAKNDVKMRDCCFAVAGEKTKYDFELISK